MNVMAVQAHSVAVYLPNRHHQSKSRSKFQMQSRTASYYVEPLKEDHARAILKWRYPSPYDFYDPPSNDLTEEYVQQFLRPELGFHAVIAVGGQFVGFCSYGIDGQVQGGQYHDAALDIGLGMKPELTGQGLGSTFLFAVLSFALEHLDPPAFRLTVANFNARAIRLYQQFGFKKASEFDNKQQGTRYSILIRGNHSLC